MSDVALEVSGLRAGYGRIEALHGIDLRVGAGELVALVGANGAGKTTLLRAVSGLIRGSVGSVRLFGREIARN
ncbi:ATP-binding cassette domain-containing protein, partial [Variovorax sp. CT11-76]